MAKKENKDKDENVVKFKAKPNFDGNITKIKIPAKSDIPEIYYKKEDEKSSKITIVKGKEKPLDEFIVALQELDEFFLNICELEDKQDETTITVVSFSDTGVVITAQIELTQNEIKSSLNINSPHVVFENKGGGFEIPGNIKKKLDELKNHAIDYIQGKTTQTKLPLDKAKG